jgi:hypothetical protein
MMLGLERRHAQLPVVPGSAHDRKVVEVSYAAVSKSCHAHRSMTGGWSRRQRRRSRRWSSGSTRQCRNCAGSLSWGARPRPRQQSAALLVTGGRRLKRSVVSG